MERRQRPEPPPLLDPREIDRFARKESLREFFCTSSGYAWILVIATIVLINIIFTTR